MPSTSAGSSPRSSVAKPGMSCWTPTPRSAARLHGRSSTELDVLRDRLCRGIFDMRGEPPGRYPPGPLVWGPTAVGDGFVGDRLPHQSLTTPDGHRTTPH